MKKILLALTLAAGAVGLSTTPATQVFAEDKPAAVATAVPEGFVNLFNGKDLMGWRGLPDYWSVKDGAIVGKQEKETSKQTYLIFEGDGLKDFELRLKFKYATPGGNSGVQFRSKILDQAEARVGGYQADFDATNEYTGIIYDEAGVAGKRGIMSKRGFKTHWDADNKQHETPLDKSDAEIKEKIKIGDWNDVVLTVKGNHVLYQINGVTTIDLTDDSPNALKEGVIALQLHKGHTMEIHFKDIFLKKL